jgi:hypothetical protein
VLGVLLVAVRLDRGRAHDGDLGDVVDQERPRLLGDDLERGLVDDPVRRDLREVRAAESRLVGRVVLELGVEDAVERELDRLHVDGRPVVERDARTQLEGPRQLVVTDGVRLGETGNRHRGVVGLVGLPVQQAVVDVDADEARALATFGDELVGDRDVGRRHRDAQRPAGAGAGLGRSAGRRGTARRSVRWSAAGLAAAGRHERRRSDRQDPTSSNGVAP